MNRRQFILERLDACFVPLTCGEITHNIAQYENISKVDQRYLNGSVSKLLLDMLKKGQIRLSDSMVGCRGGKCYIKI